MRRAARAAVLCAALSITTFNAPIRAATDYGLAPERVADGVYVFGGRVEGFSRDNGGNIVNTGFIVGASGVVVVDSGPSRIYGDQQRAAIARISPLPVERVFITHAHPDHFLGNQAYPAERIAALAATTDAIRANGEALADNLYRLVGGAMLGTQPVVPTIPAAPGPLDVAGRSVALIGSAGHTDGDLMILDSRTRTLFTGDLVFVARAPTTPNADLARWIEALDRIDALDFETIVPGHGAVVHDHAAVADTRDYLRWLEDTLRRAAQRGLDMNEVMRLPLPPRFRSWAAIDEEYPRSVAHLYPRIELESLPELAPAH